ncbi:40S ribosomal protein S20-1 [Glycine max]|nr:40S ribosomal protein S20-1 [Glycine max]
MQRRLLVPFLYIGVTNGDICCNEAQKARLGGAPGANPQLTLTLSSYHVNNLEKDLVRDANGKRLRVKAPVRIYLICNPSRRLVTHVIYTSLPRSPFVVKCLFFNTNTWDKFQLSVHKRVIDLYS